MEEEEKINKMIKNGVPEKERDKARYQIVKFLKKGEFSDRAILDQAIEFNENCEIPEDINVVWEHVEHLLQNAEKYLTLNDDDASLVETNYGLSEVTHLTDVETLMKKQIKQIEWLVDQWIPNLSQILIAGKPGSCKTYLTEYLSVCLVTGRDFLGLKTKQIRKILIVDMENGEEVWNERFRFIKNGLGMTEELPIIIWYPTEIDLFKDHDYEKLKQIIKDNEIELVIIDTIARVMGSIDQNDNNQVNMLYMEKLRPLFFEFKNLNMLLIHHLRKSTGEDGEMMDLVRGAGDWVAQPNVVMCLSQHKHIDNRYTLQHLKIRRRKRQPEIVFELESDNPQSFIKFNVVDEARELQTEIDNCYKQLREHLDTNDIKEFNTAKKSEDLKFLRQEFSNWAISEVLKKLQEDGIIQREKRGHYTVMEEVQETLENIQNEKVDTQDNKSN